MTIGTRLFTWLHGELVGTDQFGNQYFQDRKQVALERLLAEIDRGLEGPFLDGEEVMAKLRDRVTKEVTRRRA